MAFFGQDYVYASSQLELFINRQKGDSLGHKATFGSKGTAMKKLTHSESEIVKSVNELEAEVSADEICRRLNVSRATLYQWKRKYGGLEVSQLKKLKELEKENAKLKKMYANLALDNEILREVIEKKL